jgi:hypothetical protein
MQSNERTDGDVQRCDNCGQGVRRHNATEINIYVGRIDYELHNETPFIIPRPGRLIGGKHKSTKYMFNKFFIEPCILCNNCRSTSKKFLGCSAIMGLFSSLLVVSWYSEWSREEKLVAIVIATFILTFMFESGIDNLLNGDQPMSTEGMMERLKEKAEYRVTTKYNEHHIKALTEDEFKKSQRQNPC